MANIINVSTGLKTYDIADMSGNVLSSFSFNPADVDIVERYDKAMAEFESKIGNIQSLEAESVSEKYKKMKELAYDMVDGIFNADVASKFFSIMYVPLHIEWSIQRHLHQKYNLINQESYYHHF